MKKLVYLLSITFFLTNFSKLSAQESAENLPADYKKRNAIYDYSHPLSDTDSIPDFASKENPIKITGTVFLSDGLTPAKDVILFINQPDENGNYEVMTHMKKRYVHHRGWVKTNAEGQYTFYTFIPGADRISRDLKAINLTIKEPNQMEYAGNEFVFDNDPRLTESCRKRLEKKGVDNILKPVKEGALLVATKNIILDSHRVEFAKK
ncbi:MAG: hypothetical protein WA749_14170 [Gelidibacter sp.]